MELPGSRRRAQLEDRLRALVRDGTLGAGSRLPSSRSLASDLEVSRRLVVDAYAQLLAEGYLVARRGGGTYVAAAASAAEQAPTDAPARPLQFDFFPGRARPRLVSARAVVTGAARRAALGAASAFAYPDVRGACELRAQLAAYLRRVCGVVTEPTRS